MSEKKTAYSDGQVPREPEAADAERLEKSRARSRDIYEHGGSFTPMEMIKSGKAKRYSSKRELWTVIAAVLFAVMLLAAGLLLTGLFFRVDAVVVTNETDFYADEVRAASKIRMGENLLFLDKNKVAANIAAAVPYVSNVNVKKSFPSKVIISLSRGTGRYYVAAGQSYYVLDDACNVLARTDKIDEIELAGYIRIRSGKIARCIVGKPLSYLDIDLQGVFGELTSLLDEYGYLGFCSEIGLDSKFDLRFVYKDRFTVKLGDLYDLKIKFQFLEKIMDTLSENDSGIIDVSDTNLHEAVVTLYR